MSWFWFSHNSANCVWIVPLSWSIWGVVSLFVDMSENTRGVVDDAIVPDVEVVKQPDELFSQSLQMPVSLVLFFVKSAFFMCQVASSVLLMTEVRAGRLWCSGGFIAVFYLFSGPCVSLSVARFHWQVRLLCMVGLLSLRVPVDSGPCICDKVCSLRWWSKLGCL